MTAHIRALFLTSSRMSKFRRSSSSLSKLSTLSTLNVYSYFSWYYDICPKGQIKSCRPEYFWELFEPAFGCVLKLLLEAIFYILLITSTYPLVCGCDTDDGFIWTSKFFINAEMRLPVSWVPLSTMIMCGKLKRVKIPCEVFDRLLSDSCHCFCFYPFGEVFACYDHKILLVSQPRKKSKYIKSTLGEHLGCCGANQFFWWLLGYTSEFLATITLHNKVNGIFLHGRQIETSSDCLMRQNSSSVVVSTYFFVDFC